jgi:hypothetical protein
MTDFAPKVTRLRGDEIPVTDQMRAKAFWLLQKYTSLTYVERMFYLYKSFLGAYERFALRQSRDADSYRQTLKTMFTYQGLLERGVQELRQGYKSGYATIAEGARFGEYLLSPRFEYGRRWERFGYREKGPSVGLFAWALPAIDMAIRVQLTLDAQWAFPKILDDFFVNAPIPDTLPPPPRATNRIVRMAHEIPVSGTWLAREFPNPCPNYLIGGRHAPEAQRISKLVQWPEVPGVDDIPSTPARSMYDYESQPTSWQLQWEDRRYADGKIPDAEAVYLDATTEPPPWPASADDVVS